MTAKEQDAVTELLEAAQAAADFGTNKFREMNQHGTRLRKAVDGYRESIGEDPYFGDEA